MVRPFSLPPIVPPAPPQPPSTPTTPTTPTTTPGQTLDTQMKGCLTFLTALIIGGVVAEQLYKISPKAAYAFVGVVLLGYASTGGNIDKVNSFFQAIYSQGTGG